MLTFSKEELCNLIDSRSVSVMRSLLPRWISRGFFKILHLHYFHVTLLIGFNIGGVNGFGVLSNNRYERYGTANGS